MYLSDISTLGLNAKQDSVLLNVDSSSKCQFALEVTNPSEHVELVENSTKGKFVGIRSSLFILSNKDSALCSQGMSLLSWYKKNVYCPNCGKLLQNDGSAISKICHSESCSKSKRRNRHHPPINPVGICLVSNESQSKALLVRTPDHPPGMYTCISGFIEVGESIEDNIKREVAEEVGLEVQRIQYVSSQHWAFPASRLMIGCHATVKDSEEQVSIDENELEDAAWFTPTQIKESLERVKEISSKGKGGLSLFSSEDVSPTFRWVPPRGALANSLIKWWLNKFHTSV
ncbi:hypothetical protein J437_LFUL006672 [Ladona fulva]|uniref:NAD(+) diphosphatase n=1 Tax=Ladona fulva TaxID=123851 RepID=A0A8K0KAB4_LADFU|nr:hypothetical protein J437_LFUL006672 [Ladona fulva]